MDSSSRVRVRTTPPQLLLLPEFKPNLRVTARLSATALFPFLPPTTLLLEMVETIAPKEAMGRHQPLPRSLNLR
jgi:hypothetical protein